MKRRLPQPVPAARIAETVAWVVASPAFVGVVTWHDAMVKSYWEELHAKGSVFLTQRQFQFRRGPAPSAEPVASYARWLSIMRYEADISVGLLAASAGIVIVTAARRGRDRRCWGRPGAVACLTAVAAMALCVLEEASLAVKGGRGLWGSPWNPFPNAWPLCELRIGLSVLGAWVVLVGAGLWRPRGAWADRIGIGIGVSWMCLIIYRITACLFIPFGNWGY